MLERRRANSCAARAWAARPRKSCGKEPGTGWGRWGQRQRRIRCGHGLFFTAKKRSSEGKGGGAVREGVGDRLFVGGDLGAGGVGEDVEEFHLREEWFLRGEERLLDGCVREIERGEHGDIAGDGWEARDLAVLLRAGGLALGFR